MIRSELKRFWNTCVWSWAGWCTAWKTEKSLRQWMIVCLLSCGLALWLDLSRGERALMLALSVLVVASELINTAIERAVDLVTKDIHPLAEQAKDAGSAFVALTALAGGFAWLAILMG
ncbi:diacylglycerol kinase (ATP) [Aliiroseovarius sediminilitoris]|uniref:Diacylglycerol kinase n=1 Tax=Aliiroseovarius sediminilitoris TaxID=1173584 RepID=A0A1I0N9U9_9RHOB|nr:diacylglycerol kinase [Aliiroseovarius sediminilitoris]SEV97792.1 diacylglycerol kinase (ATP) [Aliiroseovarius sediminilitoris]